MQNRSEAFERAVKKVLKHEGGYVWHRSDPGGETNMGITKRSYPTLDIKNLTVEQAKEIYYRDFWLKGPFEKMTHADLAAKVFDTGVNTGNSRAFRLLQQAANALGSKLIVDGIIGPKTLAAINNMDGDALLQQFRKEQANFYASIVARNPSQAVFLRGWLNRAAS